MVVATAEVDIPESWSGVVHDAPFARHAKPRSWLEWAQLLYSERHLHPRGDGRVAPATALAAFTLCDVAVSRAYTLEMTATAGGEKRVTRGRFAEKTIAERWPRGGFVRGVVEAAEDPQGEAYTVAYSDGPYRTDDASAPPPGYPRDAKTTSKDGVRVARPLAACPKTGAPRRVVLRGVPAALVREDAAPERAAPRRPAAILALTGLQVAAALWWRRYGKVGLVFARTRRSGDAPGPRFLFYRLVGAWPRCGDLRGEVWRLWTYQLVHTSWLHLAANCFVQLLFGVPMEAVHGWRLVLLIYSAGVVAGPLVCAVCDAYAVVVGASGGAYALLGAHVGAIWKDWDRLATGTHIPRGARLALFSSILLADVSQWYLTRQEDVSYSAHLGGGGTGLLLGVLVLRRRPTRRHFFRRLRRPAFLCALIFYVFFLVFGISWYAATWPPRPASHAWYDNAKRSHRPCCFQVLECGEDPADFADLTCSKSKGTYLLEDVSARAYGTCGALRDYRRNITM